MRSAWSCSSVASGGVCFAAFSSLRNSAAASFSRRPFAWCPRSGLERLGEQGGQLQIPLGIERRRQGLTLRVALLPERVEQRLGLVAVGAQARHLPGQVLDQDVQVAHRAERSREPLQLRCQRLQLVPEQRLRGADDGPGSPRRDAELVQILRVDVQPDARVVRLECAKLLAEKVPRALRGRRALLWRDLRVELQDAHHLRFAVGALRPGLPQLAPEPFQVALVAVDQLHLELAEAVGHGTAVKDVDGVERHVCDSLSAGADPDPGAPRPQRRHGLELGVPQVQLEEGEQLVGRNRRPAERLDLGARVLGTRQLQLPARHAVLQTPAQRDPGARQRAQRRVVIGRREQSSAELPALELRQLEVDRRFELQLTFE